MSVSKEVLKQADYSLMLFVAGEEPNSALARKNLSNLCKSIHKGRCKIKIVDVLDDFTTAIDHGIIVTPTLVLMQPEPRVKIFGNLSDTETVKAALRLNGEDE